MTQEFKTMLQLFGANANGAEVSLSGELNIEKIRELSLAQGIWTMVYPELGRFRDATQYKPEFLMMVSKNMTQKAFTFSVIQKLEAAGITCCLLKGAGVESLYQHPECRVSSDVDVLIAPHEEERAKILLQELGYTVKERPKNHHHMIAYHPAGGILEVHVSLYDAATEKILFNGKRLCTEPWETIEIQGKPYHVLRLKDNLMYLTAHYIKHLVNSGGGVRQMMDLLLFLEHNKDRIDFESYDAILKELRYDKLIDVVKTIGAKYFGFDYPIKEEALAERVLTDTEMGGIFGHSAKNRGGFYEAYCQRRTAMSTARMRLFMQVKSETKKKLFPSQRSLIEGYGYEYAKHKVLIPVAWVHRYVDVVLGTRKPKIAIKDTPEFVERMQLMKDLGMIDKEE